MPSAKSKRVIASSAVVLIWLGLAGFASIRLLPLVEDLFRLNARLAEADRTLQKQVDQVLPPSDGLIRRYEEAKHKAIQEAERCADEYLRHSECLERKVLESWRPDPNEVAFNFRDMNAALAEKAGHPDFLDLGRLDNWRNEEGGRPRKDDFAELEKRMCIAEVVVDLLSTERSCVIRLMKITSAQEAPAPEPPRVNWMAVRHRSYPVEVQFTTTLGGLGRLLALLVTVPPRSTQVPCMSVRDIAIRPVEGPRKDSVSVELRLNVEDFYRLEGAG